jgi:outer membrane protein TolC
VVSRQLSVYAEQIFSSAEASAKLATNMQAIGNFNALSRARQQAFYADGATNLTVARHQALASREALIRLLGLDQGQTESLRLPDRLPDIPESPIAAPEITATAMQGRLDVNMAMAGLRLATMQQGLKLAGEITDIELAAISESVWQDGDGESARGYELGIELPIFKSIGQVRNRLSARSLVASNTLEDVTRSAISHLRESYSAYRSSYDIARHYRDEVVPLQQLISEENVLNYNGMIIGVFELLADSRAQIQTVQSSIEATGQFWLSDAALRASLVGKPATVAVAMAAAGGAGDGGADH